MRISDWISYVFSSDLPPVVEHRDIDFDDIVVVALGPDVGVVERQSHQKAAARAKVDMLEHPRRTLGRQPARQRRGAGKGRKNIDQRRRDQPFGMIGRSEEHTSELQSLMRISYAVFCLKK